jgi:hypothetical protein
LGFTRGGLPWSGQPPDMHTERDPEDPRHTPVMLRRRLLAEGWTDQALAHMVESGVWVRPRRGAYVDRVAWDALDPVGKHEITARAVVAQANTRLVLSHLTGAAVWDLSFWDLEPASVHGTRTDGRCGRSEAGVVQHRGVLLEEDVVIRHGLEVVSATRLGLELPTVTDLEHAVCFTSELLHRGETSLEALYERYQSMACWPRSLNTDLMLRLADPLCESVGERRFKLLCWRQHLPAPIPQYVIRDERGNFVARVDFAWPELGIYVEFDGKVKYGALLRDGQTATDAVLAEKRREDRIHELTGWRCIRIVWADLYTPERTALRIRRILDRQLRAF